MAQNQFPGNVARLTWADSRGARVVLVVAYLVVVATPVVIASFAGLRVGGRLLVRLGADAALLGFAILALQVLLSARLRLLDRPFGLDVVMRFHKYLAIAAGVLLVLHPVLLALGHRSAWLFSRETGWRINLGKAGYVLLLLVILSALLFRRLHVNYQSWRFLHKGAVLLVPIGAVHAFSTGTDLGSVGVKVYLGLLLCAALAVFLYRNAIVPFWRSRRFAVAGVEPATHNTWTLTLRPERRALFPYRPGQFMFLKLVRPGRRSEEHPFTVSSSPTQEGMITATIKESGDFTNTIGETRTGGRALVEGPFGRFSFLHQNPKRFLFIAGGVGITPTMSMLRYLRDTDDRRPVTLIYGNREERDIIFRQELDRLPRDVKVIHVLSDPGADWSGLRGYVTAETIQEQAGGVLGEADVYLCGPPVMMKKVMAALKSLGVHRRRIHYERFAL